MFADSNPSSNGHLVVVAAAAAQPALIFAD